MKKGKKSIVTKMIIGIFIPIIFVFIIAACLILSKVGVIVSDLTAANLEEESRSASYQVSEFFTGYLKSCQELAANHSIEQFILDTPASGEVRFKEMEAYPSIKKSLDKAVEKDKENILSSWVGSFASSQVTLSDGFSSDKDWDITQRPWYFVANGDKPILTEPYVDANTSQMVLTISAPIYDSNTKKNIGAVGYDIQLEQIKNIMGKYKIGENGFIVLCTESGQIVYHPDSQYIQKNISEVNLSNNVVQALQNNQVGNINYTMDKKEYWGSVNKVGNIGWFILTGLPKNEVMRPYYIVKTQISIIFTIGLIILMLIIILISMDIIKPIKKLVVAANKIADGNLDVKIDIRSKDESGQVAAAFSKTVDRLSEYIDYINEISAILNQIAEGNLIFELEHDYIGEFSKIKTSLLNIKGRLLFTLTEITSSSDKVAIGADQVSAAAQALSQGTTEQAASIQELSSAIAEISEKVKINADHSTNASEKTETVSEEMEFSNTKMQQTIEAMNEINHSAGEIEKIIKTIEDISFQTNILALNAAVEAARAGQAGKGFAVVADEVRNLASKSSQAAKNTTTLIQNAIQSVEKGTGVANETAQSMLTTAQGAKEVSQLISHISTAFAEQAETVIQITQGIQQVSAVIQSNSATSQQTAASSEELSEQAQTLKTLVNKFHIDEHK